MLTSFIFKNFEPSTDLVIQSNTALDRLLDQAPYGAPVVAQLEKIENGYWAAVDVNSNHGPFSGRSFASDPKVAVTKVVDHTIQKISHWKTARNKSLGPESEASWMPDLSRHSLDDHSPRIIP